MNKKILLVAVCFSVQLFGGVCHSSAAYSRKAPQKKLTRARNQVFPEGRQKLSVDTLKPVVMPSVYTVSSADSVTTGRRTSPDASPSSSYAPRGLEDSLAYAKTKPVLDKKIQSAESAYADLWVDSTKKVIAGYEFMRQLLLMLKDRSEQENAVRRGEVEVSEQERIWRQGFQIHCAATEFCVGQFKVFVEAYNSLIDDFLPIIWVKKRELLVYLGHEQVVLSHFGEQSCPKCSRAFYEVPYATHCPCGVNLQIPSNFAELGSSLVNLNKRIHALLEEFLRFKHEFDGKKA